MQKLVLKSPVEKWQDLRDRLMWGPAVVSKLSRVYK